MKLRLTRLVLAAACAIAALPQAALAQGATKPIDARIVNTPSQPVPVSDKTAADAAGRAPYQQFASFTPFYGNTATLVCDNVNRVGCKVLFTPVPAGKRLVITSAFARFTLASGGNAWVTLSVDGESGEMTLAPAERSPSTASGGYLITNSPVTFYVEAGKTPVIDIYGFLGSSVSNAGVVGYLIDVQ